MEVLWKVLLLQPGHSGPLGHEWERKKAYCSLLRTKGTEEAPRLTSSCYTFPEGVERTSAETGFPNSDTQQLEQEWLK